MANDSAAIAALVTAGDDPDLPDGLGFSPLHLGAQEWALAACRTLLDAGASVDSVNSYGNTPLSVAVFNSRGRGEVIALLRECGADPRHVNNSGQDPVGLARLIGNFDVAQFFADIP